MFSHFETLSNLPKPFELFTKKTELNLSSKQNQETTGDPIREGLTTKTTDDTKSEKSEKSEKSKLVGFLVAVFCILFVLIGLIYYFNSNITY